MADLAQQRLAARNGYAAKVSVRVPGVPCFCLLGQRYHRNAGANVYFLVGETEMQQRCWHSRCRAMDKKLVNQRSPWIPIQTMATTL